VGACLVWCGLDAAMTMYVVCRQFLGIVEAGTQFRYPKKIWLLKLLAIVDGSRDLHGRRPQGGGSPQAGSAAG
jgi:hypothetical protein